MDRKRAIFVRGAGDVVHAVGIVFVLFKEAIFLLTA